MNVLGRTIITGGDLTTSSATFGNVTGAAVTCVTPAVNCLVVVCCTGNCSDGSGAICLDMHIDGVAQGGTFGLIIGNSSLTTNVDMSFVYTTAALTAASHVFQLRFRTTAGTFTVFASSSVTPLVMSVIG